ncbi:MAG: AMP-binding protein [Sphaerochaetaceae bacterium]|nr:AMP-binding protein [Sphaerochaetaceae bacterium]
MKIAFSTRYVDLPSFSSLCRFASEYGMDGFEIYDAAEERNKHSDSVLRAESISEGRIAQRNHSVEVSAITFPLPVNHAEVSAVSLVQYIDMAALSSVENVIVSIDDQVDATELLKKFEQAIEIAEKKNIDILFETSGPLSKTSELLDIINVFASPAIGAAWNVRESYFFAGESAETTIKTLGAYIRYVRIGDRLDDTNVLIGEGKLPVEDFLKALRSLNYEGFFAVDWNDEVQDADIVLTHFGTFISRLSGENQKKDTIYFNRSRTGTFPWKKYKVINKTFGEVLDTMAEKYPDQYAFKYTTLDYTRTYSEFKKDVDTVAAAFISLGVKPGYHVAVWATNIPAWFLSFWAATKIGAVLVTVNTAYKIHEVEYLLRQSDTHTLVMIESLKDIGYKEIVQELCPELEKHKKGEPLFAKRLPFLRNVITVGFDMEGALNWDQMLERADSIPQEEVRRRASMVRPDDVCNMQYTSGTTGFPKGVMLTHKNIINNGKTIGDRMDISTADRMMIQVPMFHCFGMVLSMTNLMTHGGTICPMPYFSPRSSLACINQEKITCFNGVPTMFIAMFNHADFAKTDFSYMRTGIMAGANCPADLMRRASVEMNMKEILSVYGQTESSPGCTMGEVNEDLDHRVDTVGSAFPGVECKIIDPETGKDLPDGENGEFVARGFNIMKGYYKMPEATAKTIDADGWLHTGDICCRTPDGYFKVTGRLKDMIIRGGENIYPREIEEFYLTNPKIKDVQVVGVKDNVYGEEACAWVILHDGQSADEAEMKDYGYKSMAKHKVPRYFVFVESFPMNAAGKILKYKMKEVSEKRFNLC